MRSSGGGSGPAASTARKGRGRGAVLSVHCRSCGRGLNDGAERKLGRHVDCPATFDEGTLELLREWRRQEAASASLPAYCVFTDATLVAIAEARPRSGPDLYRVQGLGKVKIDKYGDQVLAVMAAGEERASAAS
jgi:DNA helicase-2/ATP-dependent DNA helicase PcrA